MGNCAAPPLAIIYMDHIERQILALRTSLGAPVLLWKRYIDDIFFIISGVAEDLLATANSVNPHIQFTLEKQSEGAISFLDTKVVLQDRNFKFHLYIKPSHSGTCMPFDSHAPLSRKKCLIISENIRAQRVSSSEYSKSSTSIVNDRLCNNGYPNSFVNSIARNIRTNTTSQAQYTTFIRIPYRSEQQRRRIIQISKRTGMHEKVRLVFTTEKSLSWQFRPRHESCQCPNACSACQTAIKQGQCFVKNSIYRIQCMLCNCLYYGQTGRTIRSRIAEHASQPASHVYMHMQSHGHSQLDFQWSIITTHRYKSTRLIIEAMCINSCKSELLINGCEGSYVLPYLRS